MMEGSEVSQTTAGDSEAGFQASNHQFILRSLIRARGHQSYEDRNTEEALNDAVNSDPDSDQSEISQAEAAPRLTSVHSNPASIDENDPAGPALPANRVDRTIENLLNTVPVTTIREGNLARRSDIPISPSARTLPIRSFSAPVSEVLPQPQPQPPILPTGLALRSHRLVQLARRLTISLTCSTCGRDGAIRELVYCFGCRGTYHQQCWIRGRRHRAASRYRCENPTSMRIHIWVQNSLSVRDSKREQVELHVEDIWTKWFGVPHTRDLRHGIDPLLTVWPRMQTVLQCSTSAESRTRCPSLCSFFGETGAGKSTVIRALISLYTRSPRPEAPVPGHDEDSQSTSGDVHLCPDPNTITQEMPLLYVDCEGLRGDQRPLAADLSTHLSREQSQRRPSATQSGTRTRVTYTNIHERIDDQERDEELRRNLDEHEQTASKQWPIRWSDLARGNSRWRKDVVANLYPRFLYMFSDVVCYVTKNPRTFTADLTNLIGWAAKGYDQTTNQQSRPALFIVVNNDNRQNILDWCGVDFATDKVLDKLETSGWFDEQKSIWQRRGKPITNARELLLCYYCSFRVVSIPSREAIQSDIILQQYQKLYDEVREAGQLVQRKRHTSGISPDVETFTLYTEIAFEALSKNLERSVDFYDIIRKVTKLPQNFTDHLISSLGKLQVANGGWEQQLVQDLDPYLAASLTLELSHGIDAFEDFHEQYWRCEAEIVPAAAKPQSSRRRSRVELDKTDGTTVRCVNTLLGHKSNGSKGHQFYERPSDVVPRQYVGDFESSFDPDELMRNLVIQIENLRFNRNLPELRQILIYAAETAGLSRIKSNTTCFICFCRMPTHSLPCRHSFCSDCLLKLNQNEDELESQKVVLKHCPLHIDETSRDLTFAFKPRNAGVRVLTLDGGGVRGILELHILEALAEAVGFNIPIQEMFDLVLGTSSGGIIALGIFKERWSIKQAVKKFQELAERSFDRRFWMGVPVIKYPAQYLYSYQYQSEAIEQALRRAFARSRKAAGKPLFGTHPNREPDSLKVGVIAMNGEDNTKPCLISNYSRDWGQHVGNVMAAIEEFGKKDYLCRQEDPNKELLTWEAARCTSAAPTYFKHYVHKPTRKSFVDGGLRFNNPIEMSEWERRLVWAGEADRLQDLNKPDIMLSIGAGVQANAFRYAQASNKTTKILPSGIKQRVQTAQEIIRSTLDCESKFYDFCQYFNGDSELLSRCHRLNVVLDKKPCRLDDVDKIPELKAAAQRFLSKKCTIRYNPNYENAFAHISDVAARLRASLFYFEASRIEPRTGERVFWQVQGRLRCRLKREYRREFINLLQGGDKGRLRFSVGILEFSTTTALNLEVNLWDLDRFLIPVTFPLAARDRPVHFRMRFGIEGPWELISGFPRFLEVSESRGA